MALSLTGNQAFTPPFSPALLPPRSSPAKKFASIETEIQSKHPRMQYSQLLAEVHKALEEELIHSDSDQATDGRTHPLARREL
jgi:hypothetical protein